MDEFAGIKIHLATPEELNSAAVFGKKIEVDAPLSAYLYRGDIWVNDAAFDALRKLPEKDND